MKYFHKSISLFFILSIAYFAYDFYNTIDENLLQYKYDWSKVISHGKLNSAKVVSFSENFVEIKTSKNKIPDESFILKLRNKHKTYYFNFNSYIKKNDILRFSSGFWLIRKPDNDVLIDEIEILELPLKKTNKVSVCTITDSQLIWREGRYFRKYLSEEFTGIDFVGNKRDVFGFPYVGGFIYTSKDLLNEKNIPVADYYIISLGSSESKIDIKDTVDNIKKINLRLINKNPNGIILWLTQPQSPISAKNKYLKIFNNLLRKNIYEERIIDFYNLTNKNKENVFSKNKVNYSKETYKKLAEEVSLYLQSVYE